jgi:hypothetical protein
MNPPSLEITIDRGVKGTSGNSGYSGISGYSGYSGSSTSITVTDFTATAGQTVFTVSYTVGLVDVYRNGSRLAIADYTATNGTSITLATAATLGDVIEVVAYSAVSIAGTVSSFSAGSTGLTPSSATTGTVSLGGTLAIGYGGTGQTTATNALNALLPSQGSNSGKYLTTDGTNASWGAVSAIPSGSVVPFYQASAPTGWTQVTSLNDYALRIVSGTGGTTGGTTAFSTVFANQTPTITTSGLSAGATTLTTAQMPAHTHNFSTYYNGSPQNNYAYPNGSDGVGGTSVTVSSTGGGSSHSHSLSGSATSSAITLNVQYANFIICSKN